MALTIRKGTSLNTVTFKIRGREKIVQESACVPQWQNYSTPILVPTSP